MLPAKDPLICATFELELLLWLLRAALFRLGLVRLAETRLELERLAVLRLALLRLAETRLELERLVVLRLALLRLAVARRGEERFAEGRRLDDFDRVVAMC